MLQCTKCGKIVKDRRLSFKIWKFEGSFPEFYDKLLCNSCYDELYAVWTETEELCEHLRRLGLNATVESRKRGHWRLWEFGTSIGSVEVANREINSVRIMQYSTSDDYGQSYDQYQCDYVVRADVEGLEGKLRAHTKPVRKGFLFRVVDFEWKGRELAQVLNGDADIRKTLFPLIAKYRGHSDDRPHVEVPPYRKLKCVRIKPHPWRLPLVDAFPTIETFEIYDRIAKHIHNIAARTTVQRMVDTGEGK